MEVFIACWGQRGLFYIAVRPGTDERAVALNTWEKKTTETYNESVKVNLL